MPEGSVICDVGANLSLFSAYAAKKKKNVLAENESRP